MSTKFLSPGWRMPRNANQSKQSNYSLDFNGSNNYISIGNLTSIETTQFTISMWINITSTKSTVLFNSGPIHPNGIIFQYTGNDFYIAIGGAFFRSSSITLNTGDWYNVLLTTNGTTAKLYINGTQFGSDGTIGSGRTGIGSNAVIAKYNYSSGFEFNGYIDAVSIFDYALSQSQVTTLYGTGSAIGNPMALPSTPIAYYPLGGSAGAFRTPVNVNDQWLTENNAIGDYVFGNLAPNDYISLGNDFVNSTTFPDGFTMDCWVKNWNVTGNAQNVFINQDNGGSGLLSLYSSWSSTSDFRIWLNAGSGYVNATNSSYWSDNTKWVHLCAVWDRSAGTLVLYSNGQPGTVNSSAPTSWGSHGTGIETQVGNTNAAGALQLEMSNVHFWNGPISASEVETLYNYGSPIQTLANIPQSSNLKAWYKLDATEIYNSSTTEWEVNNALSPWTSSLNLVPNDYIDCGNDSSLSISGDLTLSAWVYLDTTPNSYMSIFSKMSSTSRNYTLYARNNRQFSITTQASGGVVEFTTSNTAIPLKTWTHIVVTFDSGVNNGIKYYFNGIQDAITGTHNVVADTSNLNIGKRTTSTQYLDGKISNAQIFNTALSATEVETIYNNGTPLTDMSSFSSLVSWWKLDNTTTGIEDSKGSNNGTNNGATEVYGSVSTLNGESTGMSQTNLVQSDLQTVAPYSKYAMNFDGANDYIDLNSDITLSGNKSVSFWVNFTSTIYAVVFGGDSNNYYPFIDSTNINIRAGGAVSSFAHGGLTAGIWYNVCIAGDGTNATAYLNGSSLGTGTDRGFTFKLINGEGAGFYGVNGKLSNCAIWNTTLTSSQVREIYNEGLPSNLHNFSGTAPVAWWQLGENSSFNGNDWIVADEIGSNNGESDGMGVDALTNGVGTTANGSSTGMSEGSLVGDAPYSTANAISSGMPVTARGTDVPPTP